MQDLGHRLSETEDMVVRILLTLIGRMALHAFKLCFYHPITGDLMEFETPYPADFKKLFLKK